MPTKANNIEELSAYIRMVWVEERRYFDLRNTGASSNWGAQAISYWDGGMDANGKRHTPVWPKIAEFCRKHNLRPDVLVRAIFHSATTNAPNPNVAYNQKALNSYKIFTSPSTELELRSKIINSFESQKSRAISEVTRRKQYQGKDDITAWRMTIASRMIPLSDLFRYCVCKNQGWDDLSENYFDSAVTQYLHDPDIYDLVWKDWITPELKEQRKRVMRYDETTDTAYTEANSTTD